jgi:FtsH-binding integral membrane protein
MTTEATKQAVDAVSVVTVIGTLADVLPAIAALFTIVWTGFRIYELQTIQNWLKRKK